MSVGIPVIWDQIVEVGKKLGQKGMYEIAKEQIKKKN